MIKFEFSAGEVGELILACQTMVDANNKSIAVHEKNYFNIESRC